MSQIEETEEEEEGKKKKLKAFFFLDQSLGTLMSHSH